MLNESLQQVLLYLEILVLLVRLTLTTVMMEKKMNQTVPSYKTLLVDN